MFTFVPNEDRFWQLSPAAAEIFAYLRENTEVAAMPWGFDSGGVSNDRRSTHANFSCGALSGWGKDELTVSAALADDGSWQLKHAIKRAA
ncbi:MAG: hypothetical protein Q8K62_10425 [Thiobacillus sp.]|nr:hypothetical protein [Thiobacillus sp.]